MPPALASKRALPSKEQTLFKELLTLYETRQLKKGLKAADQILKKAPEHGETMCMKGLILTHLGRREEGLDLVKKGIRFDLTSHIVWHVFGLIQKGEKNYEEALKSYTQALRFDKENMNIMRDAANLQAYLRHFEVLVETRTTLLRLRPNLRQNWVALAVAHHLNGNPIEAKKVLEQYEATIKDVPAHDVEYSEVLLYHIRILEELEDYSQALSILDSNAKSRVIVDRIAVMEFRARILTKSGQTQAAQDAWRTLIQQNPDNPHYYHGFLKTKDINLESLTEETRSKALECLKELSDALPKVATPKRLSLNAASGDEFVGLVKPYIESSLKKGIPSLFVDLKPLYSDSFKRDTIETAVDAFRSSLAPPSPTAATPGSEPPTTYLWSLYFLAQHHTYLGDHTKALSYADEALTHTPTLPELLSVKARILKRAGDPYGAARLADDARLLDGQDRFLNTKCAKYFLRAGFIDEASNILGLFTKKDAASPGADLTEMQSLLYLTEESRAHERLGNFALALKRCSALQKVFADYEDDQYDFHSYSMRKFNLNAYISMMKWEDNLRLHPAYVSTALLAVGIYVRLHDDPSLAKGKQDGVLTDAEKKAKKKAKKASQKQQEDPKKPSTNTNEDKGLEPPVVDDDPDGTKMLATTTPLEDAQKWLDPIIALDISDLETWLISYDVAIRRKKYIQAARTLHRAKSIDEQSAGLHWRIVDFHTKVKTLTEPLAEPVNSALVEALRMLLPDDVSPENFNGQYLQRHPSLPGCVLSAAKATKVLGASQEEVESTVFSILNPDVSLTAPTALEAWEFLKSISSSRADELQKACASRFPLSTVFLPPTELAERRRAALTPGLANGTDDQETIG